MPERKPGPGRVFCFRGGKVEEVKEVGEVSEVREVENEMDETNERTK